VTFLPRQAILQQWEQCPALRLLDHLIDNKPTAFRAGEEDLLPTLAQLRRTNAEVVLKWFARGGSGFAGGRTEAQKGPPVIGAAGRTGVLAACTRIRAIGSRRSPVRQARGAAVRTTAVAESNGAPVPARRSPMENKTGKPPCGAPRGDRPRWRNQRPPWAHRAAIVRGKTRRANRPAERPGATGRKKCSAGRRAMFSGRSPAAPSSRRGDRVGKQNGQAASAHRVVIGLVAKSNRPPSGQPRGVVHGSKAGKPP
jgi:hypothetical protein